MGSFYIIQSFRPQVNTRKKHEVIQNNHDFRKFYIKPLTPLPVLPYNTAMITTQLLLANEGYTHANWLFKNICTNFSRVYYILGGEGYCRYEGRTFRLKEHCLYFFPARRAFDLYDNANNKLLHTYVHICTDPAIGELIELNVEPDTFWADAITLLRKYIPLQDAAITIGILDMLLSHVFSRAAAPPLPARQVKNYIDSNLLGKLDLNALCAEINYSKSQLNRLFLKHYKTTPIHYYNDKRLELALKFLMEGQTSRAVCTRLHYSTPAAFCKAFKNKYGLSPEKHLAAMKKEVLPIFQT